MKLAKVIPIHKADSKYIVTNYRPISLLPIFSKIFEKLMYKRVMEFITKNNILIPSQFGFQKNKSTELAVNAIINNIINSFDIKETSYCIFLDFAKAFDTVNHDILIKKLEHYGIRGMPLNWFKSYLYQRQQSTEIEGTLSDIEYIKCGVPQGSVLGPLLFLLYINDIANSSSILKFFLFADDTTLFYSAKTSPYLEKQLNVELKKVNNWLVSNKLSLNVGKSCFLNFSLVPPIIDIKIKIANKIIEQKKVTKYLGVLIDDKLLWKDHIQSINMKIRKGIGILYNLKEFVTQSTLKTLYYSFIQPYLDYNILNWSCAPSSNLDCLKVSTNKAVRTILSKNKREHAPPLFKELDILPLDDLIKLRRASFMWKVKNNLLPTTMTSWFQINNSIITNRIHNEVTYILPQPRIEYAKRHITFSGPELWNSEIPNEPKKSTSSKAFKNKYKKYLSN